MMTRPIPRFTRSYMNRDAMRPRDWALVVATLAALVAWGFVAAMWRWS
jgi:hypothetical protein